MVSKLARHILLQTQDVADSGVITPPPPPPPPPIPTPGSGNQAVPATAAQLVDSVGVCIHPTFSTYLTSSLGLRKVITSMQELNITHYRTEIYSTLGSAYAQFVIDARSAGLKAQLIADVSWGTNASGFINMLVNNWTPAGISGLEGTNEPDHQSSIASAKSEQAALYPAIRADSRFNGIPFLNPSMANKSNYASYGNDGFEDGLNMHAYENAFRTMPEGADLNNWITSIQNVFGKTKPLWNTEHGYVNGVGNNWPTTNSWVDEETAGDYLVRAIVWARCFKNVFRSFSYELFDEAGKDLAQGHFGLVRSNGTPKDSYVTIANFMNRLDDPGTGIAPTSVSYDYTTTGTDVKIVPISRKNGSFDIAVWRAASIWDTAGAVRTLPGAVNVNFTLPTARPVASYRPNGGTLTTVSTGTTSFKIPADGMMTLVRVS
jgi:hypothetical protein